jgi:hypothetical protein
MIKGYRELKNNSVDDWNKVIINNIKQAMKLQQFLAAGFLTHLTFF